MTLKIISPEKILYNGEASQVRVPGVMGSFEILNNHAPIISALDKGVVEYTTADGVQSLEISGGFVELHRNIVSLCVEKG